MRNWTKRIVSALLAAVVVVGVPAIAFAAPVSMDVGVQVAPDYEVPTLDPGSVGGEHGMERDPDG